MRLHHISLFLLLIKANENNCLGGASNGKEML